MRLHRTHTTSRMPMSRTPRKQGTHQNFPPRGVPLLLRHTHVRLPRHCVASRSSWHRPSRDRCTPSCCSHAVSVPLVPCCLAMRSHNVVWCVSHSVGWNWQRSQARQLADSIWSRATYCAHIVCVMPASGTAGIMMLNARKESRAPAANMWHMAHERIG